MKLLNQPFIDGAYHPANGRPAVLINPATEENVVEVSGTDTGRLEFLNRC